MKEAFVIWLLSTMTAISPPARPGLIIPEARETQVEAEARYKEIAEAIVDGSLQTKSLFKGEHGLSKTMMFVATVFYVESGYRRDVDLGLGRARLGRLGVNDHGRSWCMGQINLGKRSISDPDQPGVTIDTSATTTKEGWTGKELLEDRVKCVVTTINRARQSFGACYSLPREHWMAAYAAGTCNSESGQRSSRTRMSMFARLLKNHRPIATDAELLSSLETEDDGASAMLSSED